MTDRLCVVRRDRLDLFEELCREFSHAREVTVIFDRRIGARRRPTWAWVWPDRRRSDRRRYHSELRLLGWMLTKCQATGAMPLAESQRRKAAATGPARALR